MHKDNRKNIEKKKEQRFFSMFSKNCAVKKIEASDTKIFENILITKIFETVRKSFYL